MARQIVRTPVNVQVAGIAGEYLRGRRDTRERKEAMIEQDRAADLQFKRGLQQDLFRHNLSEAAADRRFRRELDVATDRQIEASRIQAETKKEEFRQTLYRDYFNHQLKLEAADHQADSTLARDKKQHEFSLAVIDHKFDLDLESRVRSLQIDNEHRMSLYESVDNKIRSIREAYPDITEEKVAFLSNALYQQYDLPQPYTWQTMFDDDENRKVEVMYDKLGAVVSKRPIEAVPVDDTMDVTNMISHINQAMGESFISIARGEAAISYMETTGKALTPTQMADLFQEFRNDEEAAIGAAADMESVIQRITGSPVEEIMKRGRWLGISPIPSGYKAGDEKQVEQAVIAEIAAIMVKRINYYGGAYEYAALASAASINEALYKELLKQLGSPRQ
jgi:hypothetical protein